MFDKALQEVFGDPDWGIEECCIDGIVLLAAGTPGATDYALIAATDAVKAGKTLNSDYDCTDPTMLDAALIKGKILVCEWNGATSFTGSPAGLARIVANATTAVGVVLLTPTTYYSTTSPAKWNFRNFPGMILWGDQYTVHSQFHPSIDSCTCCLHRNAFSRFFVWNTRRFLTAGTAQMRVGLIENHIVRIMNEGYS